MAQILTTGYARLSPPDSKKNFTPRYLTNGRRYRLLSRLEIPEDLFKEIEASSFDRVGVIRSDDFHIISAIHFDEDSVWVYEEGDDEPREKLRQPPGFTSGTTVYYRTIPEGSPLLNFTFLHPHCHYHLLPWQKLNESVKIMATGDAGTARCGVIEDDDGDQIFLIFDRPLPYAYRNAPSALPWEGLPAKPEEGEYGYVVIEEDGNGDTYAHPMYRTVAEAERVIMARLIELYPDDRFALGDTVLWENVEEVDGMVVKADISFRVYDFELYRVHMGGWRS
jgi:hypothetical protein